jgi:hypothetical protein
MVRMNLNIDNELRDLIPPLAEDEIKQLESNLLSEGWRDNERIIVWNSTIVDGHNRYSVCQKHNIPFKIQEKEFKDKNEAVLWMIDNQLGRRNIPDYARIELQLRRKSIISANSPKGTDTREEIAKLAKVGSNTVSRVEFIRDNATEEIKLKLRSGNKDLSINKVYTDLKKKEQREKVLHEYKEAPKLEGINKKYKIIYADPAWKYFDGGNKNEVGREKIPTPQKGRPSEHASKIFQVNER